MREEKTTGTLTSILCEATPDNLDAFFEQNADSLIRAERPFAAYMRQTFRKKGVRQQDVFLRADISEGYGYKLISEEKRTRQRDTILRLCLAAGFSLAEAQHALKLCGMATLYAKIPRDAVLIIAFNTGIREMAEVDELLQKHGCDKLTPCSPLE